MQLGLNVLLVATFYLTDFVNSQSDNTNRKIYKIINARGNQIENGVLYKNYTFNFAQLDPTPEIKAHLVANSVKNPAKHEQIISREKQRRRRRRRKRKHRRIEQNAKNEERNGTREKAKNEERNSTREKAKIDKRIADTTPVKRHNNKNGKKKHEEENRGRIGFKKRKLNKKSKIKHYEISNDETNIGDRNRARGQTATRVDATKTTTASTTETTTETTTATTPSPFVTIFNPVFKINYSELLKTTTPQVPQIPRENITLNVLLKELDSIENELSQFYVSGHLHNSDRSRIEPRNEESSKEETSKEETSKNESSKEETNKNVPSKEETSKNESSKEETNKNEPSKEETSKEKTSKNESSKEETSKKEPSKEEPSKEEKSKEETSKNEPSRVELTESGKNVAPKNKKSSRCSVNKSRCEHICYANKPQTCSCREGFRLARNKRNCVDVDECSANNGGCERSCRNTPGSHHCTCPEGLRLADDGRSCNDVNECLLRNGHGPCQDTCTNTRGSYFCSCDKLRGSRLASDKHTCEDIDECFEGQSGCSHGCVNTLGRAFCSCPRGMELGGDWKTCQDVDECEDEEVKAECKLGCLNTAGSYLCYKLSNVQSDQTGLVRNDLVCPPIFPPKLGYVKCIRDKTWGVPSRTKAGRIRVTNRPGTRCVLVCPAGLELHGGYSITCNFDGTWTGPSDGRCSRFRQERIGR